MATPQTGIFALGTMSHAHLELDLRHGADRGELVRLVAGLHEPRTTIGGVNLVAGFRPELWAAVAPDAAPETVTGFNAPMNGRDGYSLPATQHDALVWIAGGAYDVVFDASRDVVASLAHHADLAEETVGWPYHQDRDLTGFIDGTENPNLTEAIGAAVIAPGHRGEGGSVLLIQRWEHDAAAWEALPVPMQERAIGRRKPDSQELDPKPLASHVSRTDQDRLGKIFRRNIGYGSLARHGTLFVGFSAEQRRMVEMLESMLGRDGGIRDELTRYTRAVSGAYYVVPSSERLAAFAAEAPPPAPVES
jgi:porphyrinogen peroxidase